MAKKKIKIFVECNPDKHVLLSLGFSPRKIRHEGGVGNVVKKVNNFSPSVGMIDEDPQGTHPKIRDYFDEYGLEFGLKLLKFPGDNKKVLVVICPKLEDWLYDRAKVIGIRPKDYSLPDDPSDLHGIPDVQNNPNFQKFIKDLHKDKGFKQLKKWITENSK